MRTFFFLFPMLLASAWLHAQKVLQIEKYGNPRAEKIFIGDPVTYQLKGEDIFHDSYIEDIRVEDSLLVLDDRYVNVFDISALRYERTWPRATGISLFWFGIGWSGFAAIGTALDGNDDTKYRWSDAVVSASALSLSFAIPRLFRNKTVKIGKRRRLRLLDLRFKQEPWED
ncbi:MAG: hypothetical protein H6558_09280 [Lewinellaceae bacterium]|nr:hypothetical protein [Lewinellaceae bacterium]MCB9285935.1 hypothetical protein [Lewinellaceae bacterium]